jgi:hypothetical protein
VEEIFMQSLHPIVVEATHRVVNGLAKGPVLSRWRSFRRARLSDVTQSVPPLLRDAVMTLPRGIVDVERVSLTLPLMDPEYGAKMKVIACRNYRSVFTEISFRYDSGHTLPRYLPS